MLAFQADLGQSSMESWQMKQTPPKILEDTWLGSPPFISHEWPLGRGPTILLRRQQLTIVITQTSPGTMLQT